MTESASPDRIYGVDFSGSRDAGDSIWIAEGIVDDGLHVVGCESAADRFGVSTDRSDALPALTAFLSDRSPGAVAGLDFPFGLPGELVAAEDWQRFLVRFPDWFGSPAELRRRCTMHARLLDDERQFRRATDEPLGALSPYGLRLKSQTFFGIRDVLRPLVTTGSVVARPMQASAAGLPSVIEVYPAGTFDELQLNRGSYKDGGDPARERRRENLDGLCECGVTVEPAVRAAAIDQSGGDALDSVAAAFAVYRNVIEGDLAVPDLERRVVEGHIYV